MAAPGRCKTSGLTGHGPERGATPIPWESPAPGAAAKSEAKSEAEVKYPPDSKTTGTNITHKWRQNIQAHDDHCHVHGGEHCAAEADSHHAALAD